MSKIVAVAALVSILSGCSIALQKKPATVNGKLAANDCSESKALPIVDTVLTVAAVAASVYGFTRVDKTGDAIGGSTGFSSIFFLTSGVNGFRSADKCSELRGTAPVAGVAVR